MSYTDHLDDWTLDQLAEGMLSEDELARATAHLGECERCAAELDGYRALNAALSVLPRMAPSPRFGDAVMARVVMPAPSPVWAMIQRWLPSSRRGWAMLAAAVVAPALPVFAAVWWLITHPGVSLMSLWQTGTVGAKSLVTTAFGRLFDWGLDSGMFGLAGAALDALQSVPLGAMAGVVGALAIAIPLSAWSLFRLVRSPMGNATYAN